MIEDFEVYNEVAVVAGEVEVTKAKLALAIAIVGKAIRAIPDSPAYELDFSNGVILRENGQYITSSWPRIAEYLIKKQGAAAESEATND